MKGDSREPTLEDVIGDVLGQLTLTERMELAAQVMASKILSEEPYVLMSGVEKNGFLIYLAQTFLNCALNPEFERELAGSRMGACAHEGEPILAARPGNLGGFEAYEVIRVCGDCGAELREGGR